MSAAEQLLAAFEAVMKEKGLHTKAPANTNTAGLLSQPGGMFSTAGLENDIISLNVSPKGLGAEIPAFPAEIDDPRFGFITGFSDDIGDEADFPCDDAPTGYMKAGELTARFGRIMRQTETIEIDKTLHLQRGANTNLRLLNSMLNGDVGMDMNMTQADVVNLMVKAEMVNLGVRMERKMSRLFWQGAITNSTANGGYKEFPGLDQQIATGQIDAETGIAMPSADSLIYDFGYNAVDGTGVDIVEYLSMMEYYLFNLAERTNMTPVTWAVVMRPELWFELSAVWPCRYLTYRCDNGSSNPVVINDNVNVQMRDAMRNGMFIDINGRRHRVILDDGLYEKNNVNDGDNVAAGSYASSIYFVPLRARGNFPTLYWEHINYRNVPTQIAPMGAGARNVRFWTDNGRYLWVFRDNGFCFDLQAKVEPRVVLRTPHLAGKIQNVMYSPLTHLRSPYPDSPYWADGGVSLRSTTEGQAVWA